MIPLPDGFAPEGIAVGKGTTFFVGSIPTAAVYRGDLRTGEGSVLVPGAAGRQAIGMDADVRGRLFVAGGPTGRAFVYDGRSGALLAEYSLTGGTTRPPGSRARSTSAARRSRPATGSSSTGKSSTSSATARTASRPCASPET